MLGRSFARAALAGRTQVRHMSKPTKAKAPDAKKAWLSDPASYPIFVVIGGALVLATYKLIHDASGPEAHFSKSERGTLDYVENDRDVGRSNTTHRNLHNPAPAPPGGK